MSKFLGGRYGNHEGHKRFRSFYDNKIIGRWVKDVWPVIQHMSIKIIDGIEGREMRLYWAYDR